MLNNPFTKENISEYVDSIRGMKIADIREKFKALSGVPKGKDYIRTLAYARSTYPSINDPKELQREIGRAHV